MRTAPTPVAAPAAAAEPIASAAAIAGPRWARHLHTSTAATTASAEAIPTTRKAAMKKWSPSSPRYALTLLPLLVSATTPWIGGASHAHSAPTNAPATASPTTVVTTARRFESRGGSTSVIVSSRMRSSAFIKILRVLGTVAGAFRRPAIGSHLHHHAPAALGAEPRGLQPELRGSR